MPSFATCRASSGSAASTCRSRSTYPQNARLKTSRLYLTQKIEHPAIVEMGGPSERCVVVGELTRVDFGPAIDEHSRRFESASTGRMVQRARLSPILDFDWHTGIEEKRDDVGSIANCCSNHRFRAGPFFGMCLEVSQDGIAIPGEARADEAFVLVQHRGAAGRAVADEQVGDLGDAFLLGDS